MIVTHRHTISNRLYSFIGVQGIMAQYKDGTGAILSCPVNAGVMLPCGERDLTDQLTVQPKEKAITAEFMAKQPPRNSFHGRKFVQ